MYFETKEGNVWEPECPMLKSFYETLKKHEPTIGGSRLFEELKEVYETLDRDLKEEDSVESVIRAV